jgi:seryl-tRNA synthetase
LNDLLKLRAEKRKSEIGFESQQLQRNRARQQAEIQEARARQQAEEHARKQEAENRRQELHKWKVLHAEAKVDQILLRNANLRTPGQRVPAGSERIIATQNAA